jgi:hypothetical protein
MRRKVMKQQTHQGELDLNPAVMKIDKPYLRSLTAHGFKWVYSEDGAHFFQKCLDTRWRNRFALIRLLPTDLEPRNFELMCRLGLTNDNPA